jgi:hypothetical protein
MKRGLLLKIVPVNYAIRFSGRPCLIWRQSLLYLRVR